jgi:hypothetical protein
MQLTARRAAMSCALDIPERPALPAAWARRYNSAAVRSDRSSGSVRVPWLGSRVERSPSPLRQLLIAPLRSRSKAVAEYDK